MRHAIVFVVVFLMMPGTSNAQELGVSVSGGYSIPGDSRLYCGSGSRSDWDLPTARLYCGSANEGELLSAQIDFHEMQAGLVLSGDFFLRIEPCDVGVGAFTHSSGRISGSLLSTNARGKEAGSVDFTRSFRTAFAFFRCRATTNSRLTPYLGGGIGIYGLRESESYEYSKWEKGRLLQVVAGGEARLTESSSRVFTEIGVNFAVLDDEPEPGWDIVKCCGWNMAFATLTVAIGLRFAH